MIAETLGGATLVFLYRACATHMHMFRISTRALELYGTPVRLPSRFILNLFCGMRRLTATTTNRAVRNLNTKP